MYVRQILTVALFTHLATATSSLFCQHWLHLNNGLVCSYYNFGVGYQFDVDPNTGFLHLAGMISHNFDCDTLRSVVLWDGKQWRNYPESSGLVFRSVKFYNDVMYTHTMLGINNPALVSLNEFNEWQTVSDLTSGISMFRMREIDGYLYGAVSYIDQAASLLFKWDGQTMEAPIDTAVTSVMNGYDV